MSAFADFQVTFGSSSGVPAPARRSDLPWHAGVSDPSAWSTAVAAAPAAGLLQSRTVAPWSVWLLGELSRYDGLSVPADALGAFVMDLRSGRERPSALDGHFVIFAWNGDTREWHVWTNRFGTFHAYAGRGARRSALGTFHPAVCRTVECRRLDWEGLNGFFAMGFFPEDRTHYEEVKILRPASHYVFDEQGHCKASGRYREWQYTPDRVPDFGSALEMFGETLGTVLKDETARGRVAVPLSGGLDSRTTAAFLPGKSDRYWCYTYGYGNRSIETRIGRRVANARGHYCHSFEIGEYLFDRMDDVLSATEGFNDVTQTRQVHVSAPLSAHADRVIAAHWGDVWLDTAGVAASPDAAMQKMLKGGRGWLLEHLSAPRLVGDPEHLLREAIVRDLARVSHLHDADFRTTAFKTDSWSFRWTATGLRAFQLGAFPNLPFYDTRMADFFCTLPTEFVRGRRLQVEWLKRHAPELARITWQAHGANLYLAPFANSLLLPARAARKAWRILTGERVIERNWEVQFLSPSGHNKLRESLLRPGLRLHEIVSPISVCELLDLFFARPFEEKRGYTVSMLLTFSEWLERFA